MKASPLIPLALLIVIGCGGGGGGGSSSEDPTTGDSTTGFVPPPPTTTGGTPGTSNRLAGSYAGGYVWTTFNATGNVKPSGGGTARMTIDADGDFLINFPPASSTAVQKAVVASFADGQQTFQGDFKDFDPTSGVYQTLGAATVDIRDRGNRVDVFVVNYTDAAKTQGTRWRGAMFKNP